MEALINDYATIEADFQQYYGLDLEISLKRGFKRFARLLINLPMESRFMQKQSPVRDWNFDKETQSRILMQLNIISCQIQNMCRTKNAPKAKPEEQFQPEYVIKAKKEYAEAQNDSNKYTEEEMGEIKEFWRRRNPDAKRLEDQ